MPIPEISLKTYAYGPDTLQTVDVYSGEAVDSEYVLIYVHGGAWRTGDKTDHGETLLSKLAHTNTLRAPLVSVNYRLSTLDEKGVASARHPDHLNDVRSAIHFIQQHFRVEHDRRKLILIGHSCGAFLSVLAVQNDSRISEWTEALICLEGIYDLQTLIDEYPSYQGFVEQAHTSEISAWPRIDLNLDQWKERSLSIYIVHSSEDELLTFKQPFWFIDQAKGVEQIRLSKDFDSLKGTHDDSLDHPQTLATINTHLGDVIHEHSR